MHKRTSAMTGIQNGLTGRNALQDFTLLLNSTRKLETSRYLTLQNGLCALLISDANNMDSVPSEDSSEWEDNDETEIETDEDDDSGAEMDEDKENYEDDDNDGDDEEDPNNSDDMEMEELTEKEEAKKRSGTEKLSAAALCVAVGSFCDPEDLPGLAHFLEHMVFMGSLKYPDENGFDAFLKKHGGSDNASTDCERTVFHFDIQQKYFKEALDRWAQFFIHPLMIRDAIDREVEAVDSEYQLARPSDANRRELLLGSLARPGHPMKKFFWGNAETLKHEPKKSNTDIYTRLRDFWQHYYSAHYMNVVVQSKETLDTLEKWVKEIFSQIPNNGLPKPNFGHLTQPFDTPEFYKLYRVVPIRNVHSLSIAWGLPPQERHYRVKPLHYISWLVGHEGKGSVLSFLRKKFWALALYGGNGETGFEQNSTYSIFSISVTLTDEGYEHFYEVAHVVFQYLKMLQKRGPDKRIWEEIQKIEANEFYFQDQADPIDYVESLCENIHIFCKEDFLTGDQLLLEYKPEIIADVLNQLCPLRANLVLLSAASERKCHLKERWFGTQYSVEDIDKYWSDLWASDFQLNQDLHLPEENKYIATDFALKASDWPDTEHPVKILSTHHGCVWYKKDNKFKIPKAYIRFHLISPLIQQSAKSVVLFETFVNILSHNLAEPAYEADVAQLEYKLVSGEHGLVIRVKGFNHKLPLLFQLIIDQLSDFSFTPAVFEMITEQLKKTYFNILIKPEILAKDVRSLILEHGKWSMIDRYRRLMKGLYTESLSSFVKGFKSHLYVEGLVQGNFTSRESKDFLNYVVLNLQFLPLPHPCPVQFRVVDLPNTHLLCKVKTLNRGDANSEVTVYYQSGARSLREYTLMELLVMHMEEPCFNFLRTKQTLGYHVYPTCRNTSGILGFSVTVTTQATKNNSEFVDKKIEEFLLYFEGKMRLLTEKAFRTQVSALIHIKECEDSYLGEEVDRNWNEIMTQQYLFDRLAHEVEALRSLTKSDLVDWFQAHRGKERKALSIHVVGFGKQEGDSDVQQSLLGEIYQLTFLPPSSYMKNTSYIRDIRNFTLMLNLLPYHKILK
ncbi:nardilysin-like isoform X2 [Terrapene carolina triunguis]|uniref:nardilysin-like isoform X2 n=1 Tax=Terrapene triunguis TaxID=2587831 RepID=UPI000E77A5E4|nr:nardilysin-like isoform X2 [Terrapene carolina triunguis]XP_026507550.1 nardilysin-like isoform X2 [Terrapene carolina triunguis]XP_029767446.1 nardilysin-like isoform X2 [Terrapene carolina triunguis]XP_029767447.1 nardilysin-like isoform X2 [Terrapene carolina triunguis]XP_029767448.1 nardilysin-like isoform X2 [Terrapene carolina triunguis]